MAEQSIDSNPTESAHATHSEEKHSGNWWDTWITSAKSKSAEVYSMVKKDLDEIGTAVKSEASHVFSTTSNVIGKTLKLDVPESPANVMKKSLSTFIGQVSTVLNPEPDDEDDTEVILSSGDTTMLSTYKKELSALQRVDATFIVPANSAEFDAWRATLELSEGAPLCPSNLNRTLDSNPILKTQYDKLVPDAVPHEVFWERYLFRVALLQDRLAAASRKQPQQETTNDPVLAHLPLQSDITTVIDQSPKKVLSGIEEDKVPEVIAAPKKIPELNPDLDNVIVFGDEDFPNDVDLTEEQQILLLEEYEREIASKRLSKQTSSRDIANNNTDNKATSINIQKKNKQTAADTKTQGNNNRQHAKQNVKKNKNGRSPKKPAKPDDCGNNLVEDYFSKEKDDDSNSDESWEKEFEIDEVQKA